MLGMVDFLQFWFMSFLFMGLMLPEKDVIWPFRILCTIMPLKWGYRTLLWTEWGPDDSPEYEGTAECTPELQMQFKCSPLQEWYCPDDPPMACYGKEGLTILDSVKVNYPSVPNEDTLLRDLAYILIIAVSWKAVHALLAAVKARPKQRY
jgi:hypothetical protein